MAGTFSNLVGQKSFMTNQPMPRTEVAAPVQQKKSGILGSISDKIGNWYKNDGPGRFSNPQSRDYMDPNRFAGVPGYGSGNSIIPTANAETKSTRLPTPSPKPTSEAPSVAGSQVSSPVLSQQGRPVASPGMYSPGSSNMNDAYTRVNQAQVGDRPSSTSGSPFINAVNTQQNYASGAGSPEVDKSVSGLQKIAQDQTPEVTESYRNLQNFNKQTPLLESTQANIPMAAVISTGRGQILGNQLSGISQGLSNTYGAAVQGEGQQISAGTNAASAAQNQIAQQQSSAANVGSLTQPQSGAAFFGSPVTGETVGSGGIGGSNLVNTGVGQAIQQARNGADPVALRNQLVSQFGAPAGVAFDQAMGGGYNPTASSASAQQTASQGAATQGQAFELNKGLEQLKQIKPIAVTFMQQSGINPSDSPVWNSQINKYIATLGNTAAAQQAQALMTEIQSAGQNIIAGKTPGTPTSVVEQQAANDPSLLSWSQLQDVLNTWEGLGNTTLSVLQNQARASGSTGYAGNPVSPVSSIPVAAPNTSSGSGVTSMQGQFLGGTGLNIGETVLNDIGSLGGLAARVLSK